MIRTGNEDAGIASSRVLAVADGMGGHAAGEIASASVIQSIAANINEIPSKMHDARAWLIDCVELAQQNVGDLIADDPDRRGMGTTFSAVVACEDGVTIGHIGDSRIYLLHDKQLTQVTTDHTYVQMLVAQGQLTSAEAENHPRKNLLMRAIDGIHNVELDVTEISVVPGDRFLVCSDGLSGVMSDAHIAEVLSAEDLTYAGSTLLEHALAAGAPDNVTVLIGHYGEHAVETQPFLVGAAKVEDVRPRRRLIKNRNRWIAGVVALLIALTSSIVGAKWLGSQWFVASANGHLAIYRGLPAQIGPIDFSHMYTETRYPVAVLKLADQQDLIDGIAVENLIAAEYLIQTMLSRSTICAQSVLGCTE
jgi:protein phosphatase